MSVYKLASKHQNSLIAPSYFPLYFNKYLPQDTFDQ